MKRVGAMARAASLLLAMITMVPTGGTAHAASAPEIEIKVDAALARFYEEVAGARAFVARSKGVLVFPSVIKAGIGFGGEYGEGALRIDNRTADYYSTVSASIGFQLGSQAKAVVIVCPEDGALERFRSSDGWKVGVDGSVAVITIGAGGSVDTTTIEEPIVAFVFNQKGLMYNLTLEGSKFSKLEK